MSQTPHNRRSSAALAAGIGVSAVLHAVLLFIGLPVPVLERRPHAPGLELVEIVPLEVHATEVVVLRETPAQPELLPLAMLGGDAAGAASGAPAAEAPASSVSPVAFGAPLFAAALDDDERVQPLVVLDPLGRALDVTFTELPAAETTAPAAVAAVPTHEAGGVGRAKRQWASNGSGEAERGDGPGFTTVLTGRPGVCPMPGRRPGLRHDPRSGLP
jgi:hypothetical protein